MERNNGSCSQEFPFYKSLRLSIIWSSEKENVWYQQSRFQNWLNICFATSPDRFNAHQQLYMEGLQRYHDSSARLWIRFSDPDYKASTAPGYE
ncbi:hypothetical protein TNCV_3554081 [Trichonephila clavipes]|nr:hypothetical protein TNCV_3554081 [Trichonephila clavipes]